MKKFIAIISLLLFAVVLQAQSGSIVTMKDGATSATYTPVASDTIGGTAAKYWVFAVNRPNLYYYVATARIDQRLTTARGIGNHVILTLSGSIDGTNYIVLDTTLFHPAATGNFREGIALLPASDVSTGVLWRYLKFTATGLDANKGATLVSLGIKIGNRY